MSHYTFLPWLRQGLANQIKEADGDTAVKERASIDVTLHLNSDSGATRDVTQTIRLVGPGDVVGIDPRAVVRTEPQRQTANFEPNYLPLIEFYDEDFPWRYSPVSSNPNLTRIRPWITLVVLEEKTEFDENNTTKPLPGLKLKRNAADVFPLASELWAWAHVHANEALGGLTPLTANNMGPALSQLDTLIQTNPDRAYSRLLCGRKLKPNTNYQAFVIPSFEPGRLSGLGLEQNAEVFATMSAWADYNGRPGGDLYPYYYRWAFKTGDQVDFEKLVRLLRPEALDPHVGVRPMDISHPQGGIDPDVIPPERQTMLLEGALISPSATRSEFFTPPDADFRKQLVQLLDLPEVSRLAAPDGDPIITPPIYGQWHALTPALKDENNTNFLHDLNLDPRWRAAAGLGARVIRENQEKYMETAWKQVDGILEANRKLNRLAFSTEALTTLFSKHLKALDPAVGLAALKNMHTKVLITNPGAAPLTAKAVIERSPLEVGAVSNAFRKVVRPRGAVAVNSRAVTAPTLQLSALVVGINQQKLTPFPVKLAAPTFMLSVEKAANALAQQAASPEANGLLQPGRFNVLEVPKIRQVKDFVINAKPDLKFTVIQAGQNPGPVVVGPGLGGPVVVGPGVGGPVVVGPGVGGPVVVGPGIGGPVIVGPGPVLIPHNLQNAGVGGHSQGDTALKQTVFGTKLFDQQSPDDVAFRSALQRQYLLFEASATVSAVAAPQSVNVPSVYGQLLQKIDPVVTMARRAKETIHLADYYRGQWDRFIQPVMAYPELTNAMYEPLRDISGEYMVPNLKMIQNNVISLLNVNDSFIESYLTGLNHEFARELLWREYPTDQRGSYFRQFWDVREVLGPNPTKAQIDQFKDIQELHRWAPNSALGDHNNRPTVKDNVVLVVRGELLKRYPNTVIYAQKADWPRLPSGQINHSVVRNLADENVVGNIEQPLFKAQILPDIYFIGFNLTAKQVKGDPGDNPAQNPGWFFVLRERPGEPRFGFDIGDAPNAKLYNWDEVNWLDLGTADGACIRMDKNFTLGNANPMSGAPGVDNLARHTEDVNYRWRTDTTAADVAYITYQDKVMVAIHGSEMLGQL